MTKTSVPYRNHNSQVTIELYDFQDNRQRKLLKFQNKFDILFVLSIVHSAFGDFVEAFDLNPFGQMALNETLINSEQFEQKAA